MYRYWIILFLLSALQHDGTGQAEGGQFRESEFMALRNLYESTGGGQWRWHHPFNSQTKWNFNNYPTVTPCQPYTWEGVVCYASGESISELDLNFYNLRGSLDRDLFSNFTDL